MIMMDYIVKLRMLEIPLTDIRKITGDFSIGRNSGILPSQDRAD